MKKLILLVSIVSVSSLFAQNEAELKGKIDALKTQITELEAKVGEYEGMLPKPVEPNWKFKGNGSLDIGQNLLSSDWMQSYGGNSTLNLGGLGHVEANYKKGRHEWNNSFDGLLGFFKNINVDSGVNDAINKNADMLQLSSKYLYDIQKSNLKVGIGMNFLSQFTKTYSLADRDFLLSDFLAPGVLDLSPGLEWAPSEFFKLFFSPASGRMTFVMNDTLSQSAATERRFGNKLDQAVRTELGARLDMMFEKELVKNLTFRSRAQLFNNYTRPQDDIDAINSSRGNIDINWQNDVFYKITKNIALNVGFQLMKDDDVRVMDENNKLFSPWNWRNNIGVGFVAGF